MTPENFVFWLNGFFEISGSKALTEEQVQVLKDHLKLVLTKKTPNITITQSPLIEVIPCTSPNIDLSNSGNKQGEKMSIPWGCIGYPTFKRTYARKLRDTGRYT